MHGLHLTADLHDCRCASRWLVDVEALTSACVRAIEASGLRVVNQLSHRFPDTAHGPGGVTATVLLAESHLCVHTWPEQRSVTLDVYVCNYGEDHSGKAAEVMETLLALFAAARVDRHRLERGRALAAPDEH